MLVLLLLLRVIILAGCSEITVYERVSINNCVFEYVFALQYCLYLCILLAALFSITLQ